MAKSSERNDNEIISKIPKYVHEVIKIRTYNEFLLTYSLSPM